MKRYLLIAAAIFVLLLIGAHAETEGAKDQTVKAIVDGMSCNYSINSSGEIIKRCGGKRVPLR